MAVTTLLTAFMAAVAVASPINSTPDTIPIYGYTPITNNSSLATREVQGGGEGCSNGPRFSSDDARALQDTLYSDPNSYVIASRFQFFVSLGSVKICIGNDNNGPSTVQAWEMGWSVERIGSGLGCCLYNDQWYIIISMTHFSFFWCSILTQFSQIAVVATPF